MTLVGPDIRYVRLGSIELIRRIYVAVRDLNWNTIPAAVSDLHVAAQDKGFGVRFNASHRRGDLNYGWRGEVTCSPDGAITFVMDGMAVSSFRYGNIGICVHHPVRESGGQSYEAEGPDGVTHGSLPTAIGPQRKRNGVSLPLFPAFHTLSLNLQGGAGIRLSFRGSLFEMEDHRNWTDMSFKSYSVPPGLGRPVEMRSGQRVHQSITLTIRPGTVSVAPFSEQIRLTVGQPVGLSLPSLGLGLVNYRQPRSLREIRLLRALRLDHLRIDVHPAVQADLAELHSACQLCDDTGCGLELAVFLGPDREGELARLAAFFATKQIELRHILVLSQNEEVTPAGLVGIVRAKLGYLAPHATFAAGTDAYFTELNRNPDVGREADALTFSITPQIHASDELSLVENLEAQADVIAAARGLTAHLPVMVSPIVLKPRINVVATEKEMDPRPGELPRQVDPRQMSLFGAVWTLGSVKHLAESGAMSLTYYETVGWKGVIDVEAGLRAPDAFPSRPGMAFPVYHFFADLAESRAARLVECRSTHPLRSEAVALVDGRTLKIFLANLTAEPQEITIDGVAIANYRIRILDDRTFRFAAFRPEQFRACFRDALSEDGRFSVQLRPYAFARIETRAWHAT